MKALTLHQPYATLIAEGVKKSETRTWYAPPHLYGKRLAIHAAKRPLTGDDKELMTEAGLGHLIPRVPRGKIVATAVLNACFQVSSHRSVGSRVVLRIGQVMGSQLVNAPYFEDPWGDYYPGRWIWELLNVQKLPLPLPSRGYQSLWTVPPALEAQMPLRARL